MKGFRLLVRTRVSVLSAFKSQLLAHYLSFSYTIQSEIFICVVPRATSPQEDLKL